MLKPMSGTVYRFPMIPADKNRVASFSPQVQLPKSKNRRIVKADMPTPAIFALGHKQVSARQINARPIDSAILLTPSHPRINRNVQLWHALGKFGGDELPQASFFFGIVLIEETYPAVRLLPVL